MRNGLYGSASEARILWSIVDPDPNVFQDAYRAGEAHHERVISLPIDNPIKQFAVYETDMSVFLIS